jgi:2-polyprenyl-6-methoxyphenol hydroxylase-like FAD-dependent oxidoreductase
MKRYRIAIAGCGPAGLAAALLLHRQGHDVTLFDRFETPQPLGSGLMLQPTGLAVLDRLGLAEAVVRRGAPVRALRGLNEHGRSVLDARYAHLGRPGIFGLGIHRASLFDVLYQEVTRAGIAFVGGAAIAATTHAHGKRAIVFADGSKSDRFDLVVDALGARSPLSKRAFSPLPFGALWATVQWPHNCGFDEQLLEQRYFKAEQMVGVLPTGRRDPEDNREASFFWSLRGDAYQDWRDGGLEAWKEQVRALWPACEPILAQISTPEQLVFARYSHRTARQPREPALIRIGDAWHSASPQLGQGANMALLDAWALAVGIEAAPSLAEGLRLAIGWRSGHVALYQALTAAFTPLYQSSASFPAAIRDRALAPVSRLWPVGRIQALLVTGLFGAPLAELGLAVPDYGALAPTASSTSALASGLSQSNPPTTRATS